MRQKRFPKAKLIVLLRSVGSAGFLFAARATTIIYQLRFANHTFGTAYGGLIALLNQITFYILLAELGLAAATTSLLFGPAHHGDHGRVGALMQALRQDVRRILFYLAPLSVLASVALALSLRHQIPVRALSISLVLTCCSALITFLALPYQSHFNATDRVPERNTVLGLGFALKVVVGILLARAMHSFIGLPLGTTLVGIAEYFAQRQLVLKHMGTIVVTESMVREARQAIRDRAKFVVAHRIGYLFIYQSDYLILLLSSSLALLGYYAQYQYIYAGLLSFSIALGGTLAARLAKRQLDIGKDVFATFYRTTSWMVACAAVICGIGFYLFADFAIRVLYKTTAYDHKAVMLFSILLILNVYKVNDDLWIDTTGMYDKGYYLPILEAATYVTLGLILVGRMHMIGVLYAGIIGNVLFSVVFKSFVIGRGVMHREVTSTLVTKAVGLVSMCGIFFAVVLAHQSGSLSWLF